MSRINCKLSDPFTTAGANQCKLVKQYTDELGLKISAKIESEPVIIEGKNAQIKFQEKVLVDGSSKQIRKQARSASHD